LGDISIPSAFGCLEVDDQLDPGRLLDPAGSEGLLAFEEAAGSFRMMFGSMLEPGVPTTLITNAKVKTLAIHAGYPDLIK